MNPRAAIYCRLSQDDPDADQPAEQRLQWRLRSAVEIAQRHGVEVAPDNIYLEQQSGTTIAKRPMFRKLLARVTTGEIQIIVAQAIDRLNRGSKSDEALIEETFLDARVTILTSSGAMTFDEQFDTRHGLTWDIQNLAARHYVHNLTAKRRDTNRPKIHAGQRPYGHAGYGLRWVKAQRGQSSGYYEIVPHEYEVVLEILAAIETTPAYILTRDLQTRYVETGSPAPIGLSLVEGVPRRSGRATPHWTLPHVVRIVRNPIWSGHPTQVTSQHRGKEVRLPPDQQMTCQDPIRFRHPSPSEGQSEWGWVPLTPERQAVLVAAIEGRRATGTIRSESTSLLSGILCCPLGRRMAVASATSYRCQCHTFEPRHPGNTLSRERADAFARALFGAIMDQMDHLLARPGLKAEPLGGGDVQAIGSLRQDIRRLDAIIHRKERNREDEIQEYGEETYSATLAARRQERFESQQKLDGLLAPQGMGQQMREILGSIGTAPLDWWDQQTVEVRRATMQQFCQSITMLPSRQFNRHAQGVTVVLQPWIVQWIRVVPELLFRHDPHEWISLTAV